MPSTLPSPQADCILLVGPEGATPQLCPVEAALVFSGGGGFGAGTGGGFGASASTAAVTPVPSMSQLIAGANSAAGYGGGSTACGAGGCTAGGSLAVAEAPSMSQLMHGSVTPGAAGSGATEDSGGGGPPPDPGSGGLPSLRPSPPHPPSSSASSAAPPPPCGGYLSSAFPNACTAQLRRAELVLLHSVDDQLPTGTLGWLQNRPHIARHHHVRLGVQGDMERCGEWEGGRGRGPGEGREYTFPMNGREAWL